MKVPAGCEEGRRFTFAGMADQAPGQRRGGDVLVAVHAKQHPKYSRLTQKDLLLPVRIPLLQALTGVTLPAPPTPRTRTRTHTHTHTHT